MCMCNEYVRKLDNEGLVERVYLIPKPFHVHKVFDKTPFQQHLPKTIQMTMQFPTMAIINIAPNNTTHNVFCSHGISNGRFGCGFTKHSASRSLVYRRKLCINFDFVLFFLFN